MPKLASSRAELRGPQSAKIELLLFKSNGQIFASRTTSISSLIRNGDVTFRSSLVSARELLSPRLFGGFLGVLGINGSSTPLFRLDKLLDAGPTETDTPLSFLEQIILVRFKGDLLGLAVEQVFEVHSFGLEQFGLLPPLIEQVRQRPTAWALLQPDDWKAEAVTSDESQLIVVLDFPNLFNEAEQTQLDFWLKRAQAALTS